MHAVFVVMMSAGTLTAELRGHQWVVRDRIGETVAWIAPASKLWWVSFFDTANGEAPGPFVSAREALDALASRANVT